MGPIIIVINMIWEGSGISIGMVHVGTGRHRRDFWIVTFLMKDIYVYTHTQIYDMTPSEVKCPLFGRQSLISGSYFSLICLATSQFEIILSQNLQFSNYVTQLLYAYFK